MKTILKHIFTFIIAALFGVVLCSCGEETKNQTKFSYIEYDKIPSKTKNKDFILYGGEDYSLVVCLDKHDFEKINGLVQIGTCSIGQGVHVDNQKIEYKGYNHFD